jgi:ABC-type antimicrobial peptide transport system permease subunit
VYTPFRQYAERTAHLVVGGLGVPAAATPGLRRAAASVDPDVAIFNVRPLVELRADSRLPQLLISTIFTIFAVAGLLLAVVGVYSVTAYGARQRVHEIAVRLVLGAGTREIVWLLLKRGVMTLAAGLALGLIGAFAVGQFLRAVLGGIRPTDFAISAPIVLLLSAVTLAACLVPSLRASRLDPNAILRRE